MATRNVKQIINTAQQELGLPVSATIFGNEDLTTVQLLAFLQLANEELRDYSDEGWKALQWEFNLIVAAPLVTIGDTVEGSAIVTNIPDTSALAAQYWTISGQDIAQAARIISVDSPTQVTMNMVATETIIGNILTFSQDTYAMPSDFRKYTNATWWDRTNFWQLLGPDSAQQAQFQLSGIVSRGPRTHFRNIGPFANTYRLWPPPSTLTEAIQPVFEYITNNTVRVNGSYTEFAQYFATDTDEPILDDRALILSIKWRFWEQKGMNWMAKRDEYDTYVDRLMARDGGAATLSLTPAYGPFYLSPFQVQDTNFPGPGYGD